MTKHMTVAQYNQRFPVRGDRVNLNATGEKVSILRWIGGKGADTRYYTVLTENGKRVGDRENLITNHDMTREDILEDPCGPDSMFELLYAPAQEFSSCEDRWEYDHAWCIRDKVSGELVDFSDFKGTTLEDYSSYGFCTVYIPGKGSMEGSRLDSFGLAVEALEELVAYLEM